MGLSNFAAAESPRLAHSAWQLLLGAMIVTAFDSMIVRRWLYARPALLSWVDRKTVAVAGMADDPEEWKNHSIFYLFAANLASALAVSGLVAHSPWLQSLVLGRNPLERAGLYIILFWALVFLVSLVIEWPFFSKSIKDRLLSREGLFVCTSCNLASYAALLTWFSVSGMSTLLTQAQIQPAEIVATAPYATVYFLDHGGRQVIAAHTNGYLLGAVAAAPADAAFLTAEDASNGHVKLYPVDVKGQRLAPLKDFGARSSTARYETESRSEWECTPRYFERPEHRRYQVSCGRDAFQGLSIRTPNRVYKLAMDSVPLAWRWSRVTVLPNHQAVAQLGPQVVLLDLESGAIGVIAKGQSPTVVMHR